MMESLGTAHWYLEVLFIMFQRLAFLNKYFQSIYFYPYLVKITNNTGFSLLIMSKIISF